MNSLKHINDPVYHTINNFKKSRNIWRNILYNYTFDIKAAVPISLFPISGNKVQWLEKGNAVFFKLRQKSEENQESQEWEVWSKPKKTWTNQKCCMAKANALLLVGWPRHKWGQRRPLLQSTKPINQSLQVWQRLPINKAHTSNSARFSRPILTFPTFWHQKEHLTIMFHSKTWTGSQTNNPFFNLNTLTPLQKIFLKL